MEKQAGLGSQGRRGRWASRRSGAGLGRCAVDLARDAIGYCRVPNLGYKVEGRIIRICKSACWSEIAALTVALLLLGRNLVSVTIDYGGLRAVAGADHDCDLFAALRARKHEAGRNQGVDDQR